MKFISLPSLYFEKIGAPQLSDWINHSFSHTPINMERKDSEINERKKDTFNRIVPLHVKDLSKIAQSSGG